MQEIATEEGPYLGKVPEVSGGAGSKVFDVSDLLTGGQPAANPETRLRQAGFDFNALTGQVTSKNILVN